MLAVVSGVGVYPELIRQDSRRNALRRHRRFHGHPISGYLAHRAAHGFGDGLHSSCIASIPPSPAARWTSASNSSPRASETLIFLRHRVAFSVRVCARTVASISQIETFPARDPSLCAAIEESKANRHFVGIARLRALGGFVSNFLDHHYFQFSKSAPPALLAT